ncbi:MAG: aspartate ammonia-lyase [Planctomycetes bacterium]|nr:aspartate ammonia-lyase [Planctomycetota bacterium]MCB9934730.1 aspartate ammonia-lyase [Planctomycetota bacterium]
MTETRIEKDSMGEMPVPKDALYGASTARSVINFPVSGITGRNLPDLINAYAYQKMASALANADCGAIDRKIADAIAKAADEILAGKHHEHFVIDVFQAGAGTSIHMNMNEVLANRGMQLDPSIKISPNDHVNYGQSTNDTVPTNLHLSALLAFPRLDAGLKAVQDACEKKGREWKGIIKSGRTHLQDAVPITLGQEFMSWRNCVRHVRQNLKEAADKLLELALGGSAIGSGLNTADGYRAKAFEYLRKFTGLEVREPEDPFEAVNSRWQFNNFSAAIRTMAVELTRITNDIRLFSCGPTTGLDEFRLKPIQPGSSIMPGKINPSNPEAMNQLLYQVLGNDHTVYLCAMAGQLDLNVMMPTMACTTLWSMNWLANFLPVYAEDSIAGCTVNEERCKAYFETSQALVTVLNPIIGYQASAKIAKETLTTGKTPKQLIREHGILTPEQEKKYYDIDYLTKRYPQAGFDE